MRPYRPFLTLLSAAITAVALPARAQSLDPRSFVDTPVGINFAAAGYGYTWGGVLFDPTVPIENANLTMQGPALGYARSLNFWGLSGKANVNGAYVFLDGTGEVRGVPETRTVSGLSDITGLVSVNFLGAPALSLPEYRHYKQSLLMGASLAVTAPLGQYDPEKLVNIGTNRWTFRPQVGISQAMGRLTLEFLGAVTFYTTNNDFFGGHARSQAPLYSGQLNAIYTFRSGIWGAVGGILYGGGRATTDGVPAPDFLENWRVGGTLVFPVGNHNSVKLYGSSGLYARTGGDFHVLALTWIYLWGGRKTPLHPSN